MISLANTDRRRIPLEPSEQINQEKNPQEKLTWQQSIVLYLNDLTYMLIAIVLVFLLLFRVIVVSGDSMKQTLIDGDYLLLLSNVFYREPQPGDIIVASKDSYDNGSAIISGSLPRRGRSWILILSTASSMWTVCRWRSPTSII